MNKNFLKKSKGEIMPKNMSFAFTENQVRAQTKTVTRRLGWNNLKKGDIVNACVKCMGLKKGEKVKKICQIEIVSVCQVSLSAITRKDCIEEGYPHLSPKEFIDEFCKFARCAPDQIVNRIKFKYNEKFF